MKHFFPTTLITFCLLAGCAIGVNAQSKSNDGPLTNAEIIKLVKAGFKDKTVILIIASRVPNFDLSPDRMIQLKHAGVSENIIVAMLARQEGNDIPTDDESFGSDPFFNSKLDPKTGDTKSSDGSTNIFGSSTGARQSNRSRTGNGSASGDSELTGSATVRIIKPPSETGGTTAKLEKTKSLTNDSIVELVEAGFSEGTIIRRIEQSPVEFDLKADKLEALRKRRVSDKVIDAMKAAMGEDK
ncbi:MAG TPA: hypothetical protein VJ875_26910 [Pyrinomonadaceae bacterium]|nr:hypothetical protein [Pyrinomonadaceae bacterium]